MLGLAPHVDSFSNFGGFLSGFLLGFVLLFKPLTGKGAQSKGGLFDYGVKHAVRMQQKLDMPLTRSIFLIIFSLLWVSDGFHACSMPFYLLVYYYIYITSSEFFFFFCFFFVYSLSGLTVAVISGTNANNYCTWCQYVDCVPSNLWSCSVKEMHCEVCTTFLNLVLKLTDSTQDKLHETKVKTGNMESQMMP